MTLPVWKAGWVRWQLGRAQEDPSVLSRSLLRRADGVCLVCERCTSLGLNSLWGET